MTAKVIASALVPVMALAWSVAIACPGGDHSHSGGKSAAQHNTAVAGYSETRPALDGELSFSDGEWSGAWVAGEWTPGYWSNGEWHAAELINDEWIATVDDTEFTLTPNAWAAMPQSRAGSAMAASLADINRERNAEYDNVLGANEGAVMGYSDRTHDADIYMEGDHGAKGYREAGDHDAAKGDYAEGERCHGDRGGYHGKSHGCGCECRVERRGCYDCWGVWQTDDMYDFAAIRESDYDPVMGRGDTGRGWFW